LCNSDVWGDEPLKIEKLFPNTDIILWNTKERKKLFASCYSTESVVKMKDFIVAKMSSTYNSGNNIKMAIMKKGDDGISFTFPYHDVPIEKVRFNTLKTLSKMKGFMNVKQTRFQIVVKNQMSQQNDSRVVTFNSALTFDEIVKDVERFLNNRIEKVKKEDVLFDVGKKVKTTHYVTVTLAGTLERRKQATKTFSIFIPHYSSAEVIDLLRS